MSNAIVKKLRKDPHFKLLDEKASSFDRRKLKRWSDELGSYYLSKKKIEEESRLFGTKYKFQDIKADMLKIEDLQIKNQVNRERVLEMQRSLRNIIRPLTRARSLASDFFIVEYSGLFSKSSDHKKAILNVLFSDADELIDELEMIQEDIEAFLLNSDRMHFVLKEIKSIGDSIISRTMDTFGTVGSR